MTILTRLNRCMRWHLPLLTALLWNCGGSGVEDEGPPAHVDNPTEEVELTTVRLTQRAVERIGIELGTVEIQPITRRRLLGGEIIVPPGSEVSVTAPAAATVLAPESGNPPTAGSSVSRGQALFRLVVLLALPPPRSLA